MPVSLVVNDEPHRLLLASWPCPVSLISASRFGFFHSLSG
jgi:hypothetical protein